jgi:ring-1,2-phenylacetyl-CoA epoxidase subunit PaaC
MTELSAAALAYMVAYADDEHMIGARHTSWIGMGPFLEEDLAFCSIAQDELGHAIALYELVVDSFGSSSESLTTVDHFALLRPAADYRSCSLAEAACDDWQDALVRHWLYDRAEELRWEALAGSSNPALSAIALRSEREEVFHRAHAESFMSRIASSGNASSIALISDSIQRLLPLGDGLWDPPEAEADAIAEGLVTKSSASMAGKWKQDIAQDIQQWNLPISQEMHLYLDEAAPPASSFGDRLQRSEGFDQFLTSLQAVISLDPEAEW